MMSFGGWRLGRAIWPRSTRSAGTATIVTGGSAIGLCAMGMIGTAWQPLGGQLISRALSEAQVSHGCASMAPAAAIAAVSWSASTVETTGPTITAIASSRVPIRRSKAGQAIHMTLRYGTGGGIGNPNRWLQLSLLNL